MATDSARQMSLRLSLPADMQVRAALAQQIYCERYRVSLSREQCAAYQIGTERRTVYGTLRSRSHAPPDCRTGQCRQGVAVLLAAGLLRWSRCPTCGGCGRVPADR